MALKVIITRDFDHMSEVAASAVRDHIARTMIARKSFVLGFPTGISPSGVYKLLAKAINGKELDASKFIGFNLDEYVGLPGENAQARALNPESYSFHMIQEFYGLLQTKFKDVNVPWACLIDQDRFVSELNAHPDDWHEEGSDIGKAIVISPQAKSEYLHWVRREILDAYEEKIKRSSGIDLQIVGVGEKGHVGFHESGIPFEENRMLLVKLDDNTVANAIADGHFTNRHDSPQYAVSMGAELIFEARCVVLLASGKRKVESVAASLAEDPTDAVPISYSQIYANRGGEMLYIIDREAAAGVLAKRAVIEKRGIAVEDISDRSAVRRLEDVKFARDTQSGLMG